MTVEAEIRAILSRVVTGLDGDMVLKDAELLESGVDSLDFATLLLEVQETFDVTMPPGEEDSFDTLGKLIAFVENSKK